MSQSTKPPKPPPQLSSSLHSLALTAGQGYFASEMAFISVASYSEFLKQKEKDLPLQENLVLSKAGLYETNFHFSNLANGFELYLEEIAYSLLLHKPELMLGKDGLDNSSKSLDKSVKPGITYEDLIKNLPSGIDSKFLARKYLNRFKSGRAYVNIINLLNNIINKEPINKKDMKTLSWYYDLRNVITHEGGEFKIINLQQPYPKYFSPTTDYVSRIAFYEAAHFFIYCSTILEFAIQSKFRDLEIFIYSTDEVTGIISAGADLAKSYQNFVTSEFKYYEAAIERAQSND